MTVKCPRWEAHWVLVSAHPTVSLNAVHTYEEKTSLISCPHISAVYTLFIKASHLYFLSPLPQNHLVSTIHVSLWGKVLILALLLFLLLLIFLFLDLLAAVGGKAEFLIWSMLWDRVSITLRNLHGSQLLASEFFHFFRLVPFLWSTKVIISILQNFVSKPPSLSKTQFFLLTPLQYGKRKPLLALCTNVLA